MKRPILTRCKTDLLSEYWVLQILSSNMHTIFTVQIDSIYTFNIGLFNIRIYDTLSHIMGGLYRVGYLDFVGGGKITFLPAKILSFNR